MTYFSDQLNQHLETIGISRYQLGKISTLHEQYVYKLCRGNVPLPEDETLQKLATLESLKLSIGTLRAWRAVDEYPELFSAHQSSTIMHTKLEPLQGVYRVPCLGQVAAGSLEMVEETEIVYMAWPGIEELSTDLFCLTVKGKSMEPKIPDGATLLVRESSELRNEGLYVILNTKGQATFKLLRFKGKKPALYPFNEDFPPINFNQIEIENAYEVLEIKFDAKKLR